MGVSVKLALYCELVNVKLKMGVNALGGGSSVIWMAPVEMAIG